MEHKRPYEHTSERPDAADIYDPATYIEAIETEIITPDDQETNTIPSYPVHEYERRLESYGRGTRLDTPGFISYDPSLEDPRSYVSWLNNMRKQDHFPNASELTDEDLATVASINAAYVVLGDELGVDLRDRTFDPDHLYLFDTHEEYLESVALLKRFSKRNFGLSRMDIGVAWTRHADVKADYTGMAHEIGHEVSVKHIFRPREGKRKLRPAYSMFTDDASMLTEWVTDLAASRICAISNMPTHYGNYVWESIIAAEVIKSTAAAHGYEPYDIEKLVLKGMFDGSTDGIRAIADYLGPERAELFIQMRPMSHIADCMRQGAELALYGKELGPAFERTMPQVSNLHRPPFRLQAQLFDWQTPFE